MSLRLKLFLVLPVFLAIMLVFIQAYLAPLNRQRATEVLNFHTHQELVLSSQLIFPFLITHQLASIHEQLNNIKQGNKDWIYLELKDLEDRQFYPFVSEKKPSTLGPNQFEFSVPVKFLDQEVGMLFGIKDFSTDLIAEQKNDRILTYALFLAFAGAALLLVLMIDRFIRSPISALAEAAGNITNKKYDFRLPRPRNDEIGLLIRSFDKMQKSVYDYQQRLTEEKQNAEEANTAKSQFLSRMSHELRTPLNAIIGYSQLQEHYFDETTPTQLKISQEHILQAGKHLLVLIEDIMDLSKIEQDALDTPLNPIELDSIIEASLVLVTGQAEQGHITLQHAKTDFNIIANSHRLQQVLINLLTNAIKYNHAGGSVHVSAKAVEQGQIEVAVEDTGVGIDQQDHEKVFAPFSRLSYATKNEIRGTGIGLSLTKHLVEEMNGTMGFQSASCQGTIFWVRLPQAETTNSAPVSEVETTIIETQ